MARVFGRNIGLWTAGMVGLVTIGPVAVFSPSAAALTLAVAGSLAAGTALGRISTLNARCETLSKEVDVLSQRLLKIEAAPAQRPLPAEAGQGDLRSEVHELTVEIGLLSGIVRDLSAVIRSQDDEIAALKARPVAPSALPAPIAPPPSPAVVAPPPIPVPPVETVWTPPVIARPVEPPAPAAFEPPAPPVLRPIPPRPLDPPRGPDDRPSLRPSIGTRSRSTFSRSSPCPSARLWPMRPRRGCGSMINRSKPSRSGPRWSGMAAPPNSTGGCSHVRAPSSATSPGAVAMPGSPMAVAALPVRARFPEGDRPDGER